MVSQNKNKAALFCRGSNVTGFLFLRQLIWFSDVAFLHRFGYVILFVDSFWKRKYHFIAKARKAG